MSSEKVAVLTDANFEQEVLQSPVPVLVDFWAEWCMPCRMVAPIVAELAEDYQSKLKVASLDVDVGRQSAASFGITAIPTLIIFKDGRPAKKIVGVKGKQDLKAEIDAVLE